jgi:TonB family protein
MNLASGGRSGFDGERVEMSMKKILFVGVAFGTFAVLIARAQAESPESRPTVASAGVQGAVPTPPIDDWGKLVASNNLDAKGNAPFHLGMTFQLYDLKGKATETGSFETWWPGVGRRRTLVKLAGLNEDGSAPDGADATTVRNAYLVSQLVESAVHPVPTIVSSAGMVTKPLSSGKFQLSCTGPKPSQAEAMNALLEIACVMPNSTDVLTMQGLSGNLTMLRPKTGKFHDTFVAMELRILYLRMDAIAGKMTGLQVYDPANAKVESPSAAVPGTPVVRLSGGVFSGHRLSFVEPNYPTEAKIAHLSGTVLLNAVIGKDGVIRRLVPIASTDSMFTGAATEAVLQWRYSPYLLNGEPTEVDTTITVNFAIN